MKKIAAIIGLVSFLYGSTIWAAPPASVAGAWRASANNTLGVLNIIQGFSLSPCKPLSGTIFALQIDGYYCVNSGRIVFARKNAAGAVFQFYEGQVNDGAVSSRIGGSFSIFNGATGRVDFNFSAIQP